MEKINIEDLLNAPTNSGSYSYNKQCPNCNYTNKFSIPKGETVESFLNKATCSHCGCNIGYLLKRIFGT